MDRRSLIAILLALTTYYLWTLWVQTTAPPPEVSVEQTDEPSDADPRATPTRPEVTTAPDPAPSARPVRRGPVQEVELDWCDAESTWTTENGAMTAVQLTKHEAPWEVTPLWSWAFGLFSGDSDGAWKPYGAQPGPAEPLVPGALGVTAGAGPLGRPPGPVELVERSADSFVMVSVEDDIEVRKVVSVGEACTLNVELTWRNVGDRTHTGDLWVGLHGELPEETSRYKPATRPVAYVDDDLESEDDLTDLTEPIPYDGPVSWFGVADAYFASLLVPADPNFGSVRMSQVMLEDSTLRQGTHLVVDRSLAPGESVSTSMRLYVGSKDVAQLKAVDESLGEAVQLGFFGFFGKILLAMLHFFHGWVGNWGIAIALLTVSVKLVFFPLTQMSFKSSQAMAALQPELQAIREKYKEEPEELNRQMLKLWKDNGVNPAGGCLPTLVQFPVWIALYQVLLTSVDLYHTDFLYLRDLSSVDPYCALPAITVGLMLVQQRMMPMGNMDPTQARIMKLMPLIFGVFFFTFPSGLVVYIFVNMVLTILQQWVIKRTYKPAAA
jgi:YidC/Oxa1 family membrane protein insertase